MSPAVICDPKWSEAIQKGFFSTADVEAEREAAGGILK